MPARKIDRTLSSLTEMKLTLMEWRERYRLKDERSLWASSANANFAKNRCRRWDRSGDGSQTLFEQHILRGMS